METVYSTAQVARIVGVSKVTLKRWLLAGKVKDPRRIRIGRVSSRIWSRRDVERVRKYKENNYRKGRGRKPKPKRYKKRATA
jgi:predicted site-specific integrase-resolvase